MTKEESSLVRGKRDKTDSGINLTAESGFVLIEFH